MECKQWNDEWVAYLYDECDPELRGTIESHLEECESCRAHIAELGAVSRSLQAVAPPTEFVPSRVVVFPAASPRSRSAWSFAGGFASAAALLVAGIFIGMQFFGSGEITVLEPTAQLDALDSAAARASNRDLPTPGFAQIREDYQALDNRLGRIETWLPQQQGGAVPTFATEVGLKTAVGDLRQQWDRRRAQDFQFLVEALLATDQQARQRDTRTWQVLEVLNAEQNPNVRQR